MLKYLLVAAAIALTPATSRADFAAYKCVGPDTGPVRVIRNAGACQGFTTADATVTFTRIASGTLVVAKDSRTVVMVEDYLPARVKDGKTVEALYDMDIVLDPRVLTVYREGKRVAAYDLARLVGDLGTVTHSVSHARWLKELPVIDKDRITLTTTGKRLVLDARTGDIVEEADLKRAKK